MAYEPSACPKSDLYVELLPLLNARRLELLDHPRAVAQLCGLERRTSRARRDSAPGSHDDLVNVIAGACTVRTPSVATSKPAIRGWVKTGHTAALETGFV